MLPPLRCAGLVLALLVWALDPRPAHADGSALDQAIAHVEDADFASALAAFEEAESSTELTRDDLVRLYAHRATVHFALGEQGAMEADLARLVALDPDVTLPASAPPPVHEALERARTGVQPPTLRAEAVPTDSGVEVRARAEEHGADLVRGLRAWARRDRDGDAAWRRGDGGAIAVEASPGETVLWYAEAIGPGGAVLASERSRVDPGALIVPEPPPAPSGGGDDSTAWWLVGGGSAAVVVGVIVAVVAVVATTEPSTTLGGPTLVP
ncbi:hypothetical protein [Sandaracinus amylolyticus]|uniref:hypothetical protein n=1 Tax=Sandaracinus amylolyticus TaxID=927083 RepID=UPI001F39D877|nr:hypothetical protein [Sandaracinus amylolyticus]UJR80461.1 Hypothetical protein I5071_25080 [Sandaracinus amylolyticus]